jgi:hypothetical protein
MILFCRLNAVFALSEMASSPPAAPAAAPGGGAPGAAAAAALHEPAVPVTIQIGITAVGVVAGAW